MCLCFSVCPRPLPPSFLPSFLPWNFSVASMLCHSPWPGTAVLCAGGGARCVVQGRAPSAFLVCGHWRVRGGWGVLGEDTPRRPSGCSVPDLCVSLVLLCERASPPGAHETYVQTNKRLMNNHTVLVHLLLFGGSVHLCEWRHGCIPGSGTRSTVWRGQCLCCVSPNPQHRLFHTLNTGPNMTRVPLPRQTARREISWGTLEGKT